MMAREGGGVKGGTGEGRWNLGSAAGLAGVFIWVAPASPSLANGKQNTDVTE